MASISKPRSDQDELLVSDQTGAGDAAATVWKAFRMMVRPFASLKIAITLFAMAIFIILVGTLAQVEMDMWEVLDRYFQSWIVWIDFHVLLPRSWFPQYQDIPGGFWFPGGAAIGLAMVINLTAAHLTRFAWQARGARLAAGLGVFALGALLTGLVIASGHNLEGLQGQPPFSRDVLWALLLFGLAATAVGLLVGAVVMPLSAPSREIEQKMLYGLAGAVGLLAFALFFSGFRLNESGMRILWQLIQSGFAAVVLLAGTILIYKKRGGVVLIHAGVALMMFGQFWVAKYDVEEQITLREGQTVSSARDIRQTELAVVDSSDEQQDRVVVIPRSILLDSIAGGRKSLLERLLGSDSPVDSQGVIRHEELPFDVRVIEYYKNADLRDARADEENLATQGLGGRMIAEPAKASSGTDSSGRVDLAAAYVEFTSRDGTDLGTYLLSQIAAEQGVDEHVELGDKTYHVSLRFQQNYKPYQITLIDVRKDDYLGTSTPRNYSSDVRLIDTERGTDRKIHIWMNNPLRYAGETFYQSGYSGPPDFPTESTTLAVVTNSGWMIPYVACMVVGVGLLAHFTGVLLRFLKRRGSADTLVTWGVVAGVGGLGILAALGLLLSAAIRPKGVEDSRRGKKKSKPPQDDEVFSPSLEAPKLSDALGALLPLLVVGFFAALFVAAAWPRPNVSRGMDLKRFGELPLIADGRVKPFDTLARNSLRVMSNRETFRARMSEEQLKKEWSEIAGELADRWKKVTADELDALQGDVDGAIDLITEKTGENRYRVEESVDKLTTERSPAIRWLLDVISSSEAAERHQVFRIDNLEVLDMLGLERRKSHLYSVREIQQGVVEFEKQVEQARKTDVEQLSTYQRKLLELDQRVRTFTRVAAAFQPPRLPPLPTSEQIQQDRDAALSQIRMVIQSVDSFSRSLDTIKPPLAVPVEGQEAEDTWHSYADAWANAFVEVQILGEEMPPALESLTSILAAYQDGDARTFNNELEKYERWLDRNRPEQLSSASTLVGRLIERLFGSFFAFEAYFNRVSPFFFCWWPYIAAFALAAVAWLGWSRPLNSAAFWLIAFTFIVHTVALGARMYISGRPPVTNLYSSAVFIGWGAVLFGIVLERIYRNGVGNVMASVLGFSSLVIAHYLAGDGDTFIVLQAVLDTQFWLATHVVTVTLGYATTFLAGFLGIGYILAGWLSRSLTPQASKEFARMIYGTVCFSLFFSFVGTVLGGLWADDSWGRFWGWDPKENGALIIVLWNALVLHCRWDGLVKDRGLAVLAVGGNIVTSWSWFGVNELGVGLHSYGFTEGVLAALFWFWCSQAAVIALGVLPKSLWTSFRATPEGSSP